MVTLVKVQPKRRFKTDALFLYFADVKILGFLSKFANE